MLQEDLDINSDYQQLEVNLDRFAHYVCGWSTSADSSSVPLLIENITPGIGTQGKMCYHEVSILILKVSRRNGEHQPGETAKRE
jgi:hypothetical protein